ncbi:MAG: TonB family protein [Herminiimonas sp.]|nr:TonB family protein [Herminiimonas sp.]
MLALLVEVVLVGGALVGLRREVLPPLPEILSVAIAPLTPPPVVRTVTPGLAKPLPVKPSLRVVPLPVAVSMPVPAPEIVPQVKPAAAAPVAELPAPVFLAPVTVVVAPATSPVAPSHPAVLPPDYIARVKAAVQAGIVYPPAALALNFRGRARVEFRLRDGVASQLRILTSSGMGMVDRAALQALQVATYPPAPANFAGKEETFQVWVEFNF